MLDGENKDLTMESDFLGMFNPVRGLKKKENPGSNPEAPSLTLENLAPLLINALDNHIEYGDALKDFIGKQDCALKPLFNTGCDFLRNSLNIADLEARANEALQNNSNDYIFYRTLIEKFQSLGKCYNVFINAQIFSEEGIEVYFDNTHNNNIHFQALDIPEALNIISNLDSSMDSVKQLKILEPGLPKIQLTGNNAVIDIDITSPNNPTLVKGNVTVNQDVITDGINKLTGSFDEGSKSFSIYINDTLYTTIHNMDKWFNRIEIYFVDGVDHIVYPNDDYYIKTDGSLPDNIKGFNNQYLIDVGNTGNVFNLGAEILLRNCFFNIAFEWYCNYNSYNYPLYLDIQNLSKATYYCCDTYSEYGLYDNVLIERFKNTYSDCSYIIDSFKHHLDICLGLEQPVNW